VSELYGAKLRSDRVLLDLVGDKWTVLVFGSLCDHGGRRRFNAIRRDIPGISQKSLTQCLRRLERNGLVRRDVHTSAGRLAVEYAFTELGDTLDGPVGALLAWTAANAEAVRRSQAEFDRSGRLDDAEEGGRAS
jgi:DNA-binding HxlR family transcriptional regulator